MGGKRLDEDGGVKDVAAGQGVGGAAGGARAPVTFGSRMPDRKSVV